MANRTEPRSRVVPRVRDVMSDKVLTIRDRDDVHLARQMMLWCGYRQLPVVDSEGHLIGLIHDRDAEKAEASRPQRAIAVGDVMTTDVETTAPNTPVTDAAGRMADKHIHCLPVLDHDRVVGIVTSADVLASTSKALVAASPDGDATVGHVMCTSPKTVLVGTSITEAISTMVENEIRHIPVVDADDRLVGILSDRDVRNAVGEPFAALRDDGSESIRALRVEDVMTPSPLSARDGDSLSSLAFSLIDERVGAVPVVDDDERVVGIVSYIDVLHWALRGLG